MEPRVVVGTRGLRGEAAALRAVNENWTSQIDVWHTTRPDDQQLRKTANHESPKQRQ